MNFIKNGFYQSYNTNVAVDDSMSDVSLSTDIWENQKRSFASEVLSIWNYFSQFMVDVVSHENKNLYLELKELRNTV